MAHWDVNMGTKATYKQIFGGRILQKNAPYNHAGHTVKELFAAN
jgi:hypothetical protein